MAEKPVAAHDLRQEQFPMTIEFFDLSGTTVHTIVVDGPGVTEVPPLSKTFGPVGVRTTFATGETHTTPPPTDAS